jgi:hypothetical protein
MFPMPKGIKNIKLSKKQKISVKKVMAGLKKKHNITSIGDDSGKITVAEANEMDQLITDIESGKLTGKKADLKPAKPLESNFTNNDPLDKLINEMSGAPARITSKELRPVLDKKLIELETRYNEARKVFDDKYNESTEKKAIVDALNAMQSKDPDLDIRLTVTSKNVYSLRNKTYEVARMSKVLNDKLTYPADSIEKIEKL